MGSKSAAKAAMEQIGIPIVPGYHGARQDPDFLSAEASRIGYPVLIKASAGGGGKGMRAVNSGAEFSAALVSCRREALASFGDDQVVLERHLRRPRHIEVQIFGDRFGSYVHLFERDCSVQRRHQKVLEEAPAPGMTWTRRAEIGAVAIAVARSVGYVGAGTVEFIAEPHVGQGGAFFFMEMNTRLQVEHPVTEAITGLDLVEWQLRIAAGEPLPLAQDELSLTGHAIEARICAENPLQEFLPSAGRLLIYRTPSASLFSPGPVRLDSGVREGDAISPHYDSMIAKLIVQAPSRAQALAQLDLALADLHIGGLQTNVAFLRRVVTSRSFALAELDTTLIEREREVLFVPPTLPRSWAVAAVAARLLADEEAPASADVWSRRDGFRLHGVARRLLQLEHEGERVSAVLSYLRESGHELQIASGTWLLRAQGLGEDRFDVTLGDQRARVAVYRDGARFLIYAAQGQTSVLSIHLLARARQSVASGGRLTAQMPGRVVALLVEAGQAVKQGQALAVTEAMKMEHTLTAPEDGVVSEITCVAGDQVAEGAELLRLRPSSTPV
jgi:3-methylcrotonyl-CoA carboxylase alpha subunit